MKRFFFILCLCPVMTLTAGKPLSPLRTSAAFVVENLNDAGIGSLRQAMIQAGQHAGSDVISFLPGLTGTIRLSSRLPIITDSLSIIGPGSSKIILSGEDQFRIMETYNTTVAAIIQISGLTFERGRGNAGAAIRNGGICQLFLNNCVLRNNVSPNTGAGDGGALGNFISSKLHIDQCSFTGNFASTFGGAIYNLGLLTVSNSSFSGNRAFNGCAIFNINQTGIATISNCTISSNISEGGSGSGVFADLSSTTFIKNSTITLNRTTGIGSGGGIFAGSAAVHVFSSIIAGNQTSVNGPDIQGGVISSGYNLVGNTQGTLGITAGVNNDLAGSIANPLNPMLGPLQNNGGSSLSHALLPGSPAIDAGSCNGINADQRGVFRPYNNSCDIGAFEFSPTVKADLGPLTVFISPDLPRDNGKMIDLKAEILVNDQPVAESVISGIRMTGNFGRNGQRLDIPLKAEDILLKPNENLQIRISVRGADRHLINSRIWFNSDSTSSASKGFSRIIYSLDSSAPDFLYLRDNFLLNISPGTNASSITAGASGSFIPFGTWSVNASDLLELRRLSHLARPTLTQLPEKQDLRVMPNPASTTPVFVFDNGDAEKAILEISDLSGRIITVRNIRIAGPGKTNYNSIRLESSGMYLARLTLISNNRVVRKETTRFLVQ